MQLTDFRSLPDALTAQIQARPEQIALCFIGADGDTQEVTYARLGVDIDRAAGLLEQHRVQPGELVILVFQHSYELVIAFFGAMAYGIVPTIFPYYTSQIPTAGYQDRLQSFIQQSKCRRILTTCALRDGVGQMTVGAPCQLIALDERCAAADRRAAPHRADSPGETAYIQFSSGTTGAPRGVFISHRAVLHNVAAVAKALPFQVGDVGVSWLPFFHDMGLMTELLLPLLIGGSTVTMSPERWLRRPITLLRAIHEHRGEMTWMPNFAFAHMMHHIREEDLSGLDLSSWRIAGCGGEPIQFSILTGFAKRFAPYGLRPSALSSAYGMAENVAGVTVSTTACGIQTDWISQTAWYQERRAEPVAPDAPDAQAVVACGRVLEGVEIKVINEHQHHLSVERQVGEIAIRGTSLFTGYYQQPAFTATSQNNDWFHTGDVGYLADGQLYVLDRKKDLIISGGKNISPHMIETIAQTVLGQQLRRAAAFGLRDETLGTELPVLVCELRKQLDEATQDRYAKQIKQQVREAADCILVDLRFVPRGVIEVTTSGKIARAATKQNYQRAGFVPTIATFFAKEEPNTMGYAACEATLLSLCATVLGTTALDPQVPFTELGLDSLALMRILHLVEKKSGRSVPIEQLAMQPTIAHLAHLISNSSTEVPVVTSRISADDRYAIPQLPSMRLSRANHRQWLQYQLLHRGPQVRGRPLPYGLGTYLLQQITQPSPWRDKIFRKEIALMQRVIEAVEPTSDSAFVLQQSLMVNTWPLWRSHALANPVHFEQWVSIQGRAMIDQARAQGNGVVIAFPHTQLRRFLLQIAPLQRDEVAIIGNLGPKTLLDAGLPTLAKAMAQGHALSKVAVRAGQLRHAQQVLGRGGIAIVLADATEGEGGIQASFHGRQRPFRPGIAELAIQSGAAIVPTFATMQINGQITFEFLEPLPMISNNRTQQVHALLHQYAAVLAARWQRDLGNLEWFILDNFLALPAA